MNLERYPNSDRSDTPIARDSYGEMTTDEKHERDSELLQTDRTLLHCCLVKISSLFSFPDVLNLILVIRYDPM